MQNQTVALVLAAGDSKRFGSDKRFYGSPPLLQRTLDLVTGSFDKIILVHKNGDDLSGVKFDNEKVLCTQNNKLSDDSLGKSIAIGIQELTHSFHDANTCAIFLADMPFIKKETLDQLISKSKPMVNTILIPTFKKQRGHPVIFPKILFNEMSKLAHVEGAKSIINQNQTMIIEVAINDAGITTDIDTKSDIL